MESTDYIDGRSSFTMTPEKAPVYSLVSDYVLMSLPHSQLGGTAPSNSQWGQNGYAMEIELTDDNFDRYSEINGASGIGNGPQLANCARVMRYWELSGLRSTDGKPL